MFSGGKATPCHAGRDRHPGCSPSVLAVSPGNDADPSHRCSKGAHTEPDTAYSGVKEASWGWGGACSRRRWKQATLQPIMILSGTNHGLGGSQQWRFLPTTRQRTGGRTPRRPSLKHRGLNHTCAPSPQEASTRRERRAPPGGLDTCQGALAAPGPGWRRPRRQRQGLLLLIDSFCFTTKIKAISGGEWLRG